MSGESIAEWQWRMRNADPLGLTRAQRMQSDQAEMLESVNGQWDGMVRTDGQGRPFISLDGAAVRLPPDVTPYRYLSLADEPAEEEG